MEVQQVLHMNGGEGKASYAQNSLLQRLANSNSKHILEEIIEEVCRSNVPDCIRFADLGCSSGPNTLSQVEGIIDSIEKACMKSNHKPPSIQVFLNDLEGNDFNNVFKSLPAFYQKLAEERGRESGSCFVAAMPGSFWGRLFPKNSMHFVHSSYSLHWISQVPRGLVTESGKALNKGNIYIAKTSPPTVHKAYLDQFETDFTKFLKMRSIELVPRGHMVLTLVCKIDADDGYDSKELIGITLNDMVKEGVIEEAELDAFNLPIYNPAIEEVRKIIENEGSFKILNLETFKQRWNDVYRADNNKDLNLDSGQFVSRTMRAVFEPILASHFGDGIMNALFYRFSKRASEHLLTGKGLLNHLVISLAKNDKFNLNNGFFDSFDNGYF